MRLHSLEIQAFGPFADRQSVDFDALSGQGLFLLNGPTGAGKSSVLDAVCFALYGSVPGARHGAKRLRSDHAADGVAPEVRLEFSAGGRRYRVERSPAWERPARRGGGTTPEQARTLLSERIGAEWVQKSARNDEAGLELQNLLGMDKDQFTKVVMLPQGEFAAFLRADAKPRRELLQRLFSTTRFEDLESHFAEQSQRAAREVSEQEEQQRNLLLRAIEEAERHDLGVAELGVDPTEPTDRSESLRLLADALTVRRDAAATARDELAEQSALADGALAALSRRRERADALRRLRHQQKDHEDRGHLVRESAALLRGHDEARGLATLLQLDGDALGAARSAEEEHRDTAERLRMNTAAQEFLGGKAFAPEEETGEALTNAWGAASAAVTMLQAALPDEAHLLAVQAERSAGVARLEDIAGRLTDTEAGIAKCQVDRSATSEQLVPARHAADGLRHLRSDLDAAEAAETVVIRYRDTDARRAEADAAHQRASEHFLELKEQWLAQLQRRLEQAAMELAEGLEPGEPCAVCGSTVHPAPAVSPGGKRVTLEEEQGARLRQAAAETALHDARDRLDAFRVETAELAARGGGSTPEEARARTLAAHRAVKGAEDAAALVVSLEQSLDRSTREEEELAALRDRLRDEQATHLARGVSLADQESTLAERLAELQGESPSLTARLTAVRAALTDLDTVRQALEVRRRATEALQLSAARLGSALAGTDFPSADAARAALLDEEEHVQVLELVKEHEVQGHRLEAAWAEDAVRQSLGEEQEGLPDPTEADEREAKTESQALRVRAHAAGIGAEVLAQSVAQLQSYERRLHELERIAAPLRERARTLAGLAETARGGGENTYKMSLATYVLASRLEQVAAAATERLLQMSDGRYALVHSDATAGNKRSGLGLNVIDGWTGNRRDTATLSGGESFMASLALALGLADVVQQESGGLDIETLFVDEGFGSLDDQALEQVMDALEGLRSGGRVVGLVSHVPELKQRVGAQLQVVKGRRGSSLRLVEQPAGV